jgi:hypothetical protein
VATPFTVVTGAVLLATVPEVFVPEAGVVVVVVAVVAVELVFEATEAVLGVLPTPDERSITPTLGDTSAVAVSVSAEAAAALLLPSDPPPQAASGRLTRAHRKRLRAPRAICVM